MNDGPRIEMTQRRAAFLEMDAISADLAVQPTIRTRGREWEVLGSGLSRRVSDDPPKYEAIPMGDLSENEWRACLTLMRAAERARLSRVGPAPDANGGKA